MENIDKEIQDIINRNLPAQVGEVLRKRLEKADQDAVLVEQLKGQRDSYQRDYKNSQTRIEHLQAQLSKHASLDEREASITQREIRLELALAQARVSNAESNTQALFNLVSTIFKNPVVKENVIVNKSEPFNSNGYTQYSNSTTSTSTTREVE